MYALLIAAALATPAPGFDDPILYAPEPLNEQPTAGELRSTDGRAMVLDHTDVVVHVQAGIAEVTLTQWFRNPFDQPIEAQYLLPLPTGAAVHRMDLSVGDRLVEGFVMERDEARELYEDARDEGYKAALLEQQRDNLFKQQVSGICPDETVVITLQYLEQVPLEDGLYELVLPTTVGERYQPPWDLSEPVRPFYSDTGREVDVTVIIDEGLPVRTLFSDSHDFDVVAEDTWGAEVALLEGVPDRDAVLTWSLATSKPEATVLTWRPDGEDGYLALTLEPQLLDELYQPRPRELIFVLDSSCSMEGRAWETATATVRTALSQMRPRDTFNLVSFSDDARVLFSEPQASTRDSRDAAEDWMGVFEGGGTNMTTGLTTSLDMEGRPGTLRLVVMLTDGFVNNEAEIGAVVSEHLGGSRLFALGIGGSVNRYLLEGLAEMGHGDVMVQLPGTPIRETVDAFYERISHPAMSHIDIEWDGLEVSEQYPRVLPDLWAGQPLRVVARYTGEPPESITIRGTVGWKRIEIVADVEAREEGSKVARLWARRKLADVERYPRTRTRDQVREELTELALDYGLVSRWTSLVAVDEVPCPCADVDFVRFTVPHERPKDTLLGGMGLGGGGYGAGLGGLGTRGYGRGSSDYGTGTIGLGKREPVIMGSVDHSMIEEVIKGQLNAVRACYNVQLRTEPGLEGRLVLRFEVAGDGRLVRTTAVSNTTGSEDLADCVTSRFFMMRFPASLGGGELVVNYPFVFAGADLAVE